MRTAGHSTGGANVCVDMCAGMHVDMCVDMFFTRLNPPCTHVCTHVYTHVYTHVCTHVCTHVVFRTCVGSAHSFGACPTANADGYSGSEVSRQDMPLATFRSAQAARCSLVGMLRDIKKTTEGGILRLESMQVCCAAHNHEGMHILWYTTRHPRPEAACRDTPC